MITQPRRPDPILVAQSYAAEYARNPRGAMLRTAQRYGRTSREWTRLQLQAARKEQARRAQARDLERLKAPNEKRQRQPDLAVPSVPVVPTCAARTSIRHNVPRRADVPGCLALGACVVVTACLVVSAIKGPGLLVALLPTLGLWHTLAEYWRATR